MLRKYGEVKIICNESEQKKNFIHQEVKIRLNSRNTCPHFSSGFFVLPIPV